MKIAVRSVTLTEQMGRGFTEIKGEDTVSKMNLLPPVFVVRKWMCVSSVKWDGNRNTLFPSAKLDIINVFLWMLLLYV